METVKLIVNKYPKETKKKAAELYSILLSTRKYEIIKYLVKISCDLSVQFKKFKSLNYIRTLLYISIEKDIKSLFDILMDQPTIDANFLNPLMISTIG